LPDAAYIAAMIAFLRGRFHQLNPASVIVEVNGLGYEVHITLHTYSVLRDQAEGLLHTCLLIREDAHLLYGFADPAEKDMFLHLISVSGIGAATARVMLSYQKPGELARAIVEGDTRALESIKGIGKKTAERMVLELRDKLTKTTPESNIPALKNNSLQQDALNALLALGINRQAAVAGLEKVMKTNSGLSVEELIKVVLRTL
jgi:Holliday junction DNA helicase RuvA